MNVRGLGLGALGMLGLDHDGADQLLLWAALHFDLPQPGDRNPPKRSAEQPPPSPAPLWFGEPGLSSTLWEAPIAHTRSTTEIHVRADACAPAGTLVHELPVGVRVGECMQQAVVFGERHWTATMDPSTPLPFDRIALVWEHAFGGRSAVDERHIDMRNPIGLGMYVSADEALGQRLPFIEHPQHRIRSVRDRPEPVGFLPRGTAWEPRSRYAGTFDQAWTDTRCPLWPLDFDDRYFLAAPSALIAPQRLQGGEPVALVGMHPRGDIAFELPRAKVHAKCSFVRRTEQRDLELDIVWIDVIAGRVTLVYRASVAAHREIEEHIGTVIEWQE